MSAALSDAAVSTVPLFLAVSITTTLPPWAPVNYVLDAVVPRSEVVTMKNIPLVKTPFIILSIKESWRISQQIQI